MLHIILALVLILLSQPAVAQMPEVERLIPKVLNVYPHDDGAFSQGLLWHDGSSLRIHRPLRRVNAAAGRYREWRAASIAVP